MHPQHTLPAAPEFLQLAWDDWLATHVARLAADWFLEDLAHECDWTSISLVAPDARSELAVVARKPGVVAGLPLSPLHLSDALKPRATS